MTKQSKDRCFTEEDFYTYVTKPGLVSADLDRHLLACSACREELAGLLRLLQPSETPPEEPTPAEIESTLALIARTSGEDTRSRIARARRSQWLRAPTIAAGAVLAAGLGLSWLIVLRDRWKSDAFFSEAQTLLEQCYSPSLDHGVRLDLPFAATARLRAAEPKEALERANELLLEALGVRPDMVEARLALGYVYLNQSKFERAQLEFQKVLQKRSSDPRALLGRGVSLFEAGLGSRDPAERNNRLASALADFEAVLKYDPGSREARYDRALALFESGRLDEALREIDAYLARDPDSLWAERLKEIASKIRLNRAEAVDREVERAAEAGDAGALAKLATLVPYQTPRAIRNALKKSVQTGSPRLAWAAAVIRSG